jgi:hypothetical protein
MTKQSIRAPAKRPDDVYRAVLDDCIAKFTAWRDAHESVADIQVEATGGHWRLSAAPYAVGACAFELLVQPNQRFSLVVGDEVFEDKPVTDPEVLVMLVKAISAGRVQRIEVSNALTGQVERIETRISLEDGWDWIGERRIASRPGVDASAAEVLKTRPYLAYRRS